MVLGEGLKIKPNKTLIILFSSRKTNLDKPALVELGIDYIST